MADQLFSKTSIFIIVVLVFVCLLFYATYMNVYTTSNEQIAELQQQLSDAKASSGGTGGGSGGSTPTPTPTPTTPTTKSVTLNVNPNAVYTSSPTQSGSYDGYFVFDLGQVPNDLNHITNITFNYNLSTQASVSFMMLYPTPSSITATTATRQAQLLWRASGLSTSGSDTISPSTQVNTAIPFTSYEVIEQLQGYHMYLMTDYLGNRSMSASGSMTITYI